MTTSRKLKYVTLSVPEEITRNWGAVGHTKPNVRELLIKEGFQFDMYGLPISPIVEEYYFQYDTVIYKQLKTRNLESIVRRTLDKTNEDN